MRATAAILAVALAVAAPARSEEAVYTKGPTHPDGTEVMVDMPDDLWMVNTVGRNNLGLCVYTSINHSAIWQNAPELFDLQAWMTSRPGGGYPEKVDRELTEKAPGLDYAHYLGRDPGPILEAALRSGRCPGITYGFGERYRGRISHMVNVVHYDRAADRAAIRDNNYPDEIAWMSTAELHRRALDTAGYAWIFILFNPPPPPVPTN